MGTYHIQLADHRTCDVSADDIDVVDGALVCGRDDVVVLALAPDQWTMAYREGSSVRFAGEPRRPEPMKPIPRVL